RRSLEKNTSRVRSFGRVAAYDIQVGGPHSPLGQTYWPSTQSRPPGRALARRSGPGEGPRLPSLTNKAPGRPAQGAAPGTGRSFYKEEVCYPCRDGPCPRFA